MRLQKTSTHQTATLSRFKTPRTFCKLKNWNPIYYILEAAEENNLLFGAYVF